jgi:methionine-S-sulfoxide reductase
MTNQTIVLGGGCFWCTEAVFRMVKGINSAVPGYAGGQTADPTYKQVCEGQTGHAEVVEIQYDPQQVKLTDILTVFFGSHDPTTLNRQGNDVGTQYRSVIFYSTEEQKIECEKFIQSINSSSQKGKEIVTELLPLDKFYKAEDYHQNYYENNSNKGYCQIVINPKLQKVTKDFAELLNKNESRDVS